MRDVPFCVGDIGTLTIISCLFFFKKRKRERERRGQSFVKSALQESSLCNVQYNSIQRKRYERNNEKKKFSFINRVFGSEFLERSLYLFIQTFIQTFIYWSFVT